jgi:hypothetical protein
VQLLLHAKTVGNYLNGAAHGNHNAIHDKKEGKKILYECIACEDRFPAQFKIKGPCQKIGKHRVQQC